MIPGEKREMYNMIKTLDFNFEEAKESFVKNNKIIFDSIKIDDIPFYPDNDLFDVHNLPNDEYDAGWISFMCWNVRYWTDVNNKPTINEIVNFIIKKNPKIVCLQEISLGKSDYYDTIDLINTFDKSYKELTDKYKVISLCSVSPSWYSDFYGNAILINRSFFAELLYVFDTYIWQSQLCPNELRCKLGQETIQFENPVSIIEERNDQKIKYQTSANEKKCFIKLSFPEFDIINVHLDAYSIKTRIEQLKKINNEIIRPTIIMGDFNFFDYGDLENLIKINKNRNDFVVKTIKFHNDRGNDVTKNLEYKYIHDELKWTELLNFVQDWESDTEKPMYLYSQWAMTRVDHVFFAKMNLIWDYEINLYPISFSDHLPILFSIKIPRPISYMDGHKAYISNFLQKRQPVTVNREGNKSTELSLTQLFNCQPIKACDWIMPNKTFKTFNDPYLTGNSRMAIGNNGVYLAEKPIAINFGLEILNNSVSFNNFQDTERKYLENILLGFTFDYVLNDDKKILGSYKNRLTSYKFKPSDDEDYDVIISGVVIKVTPKSYNLIQSRHKYLIPNKISIITIIKDDTKLSMVCADKTNSIEYDVPHDLISKLQNEIKNVYPEKIISNDCVKEYCIMLKKAIDWINKKYYSEYNVNLTNFDWNKINLATDWTQNVNGSIKDYVNLKYDQEFIDIDASITSANRTNTTQQTEIKFGGFNTYRENYKINKNKYLLLRTL